MQIVSLIANDKFMSQNNMSAPTEGFVDLMTHFHNFFRMNYARRSPYPLSMYANWSSQYDTNWTRVLFKTGFCFTFNYPNASQIFHSEKIAKDFDYTNVTLLRSFSTKKFVYKHLVYPLKGPKNHVALDLQFATLEYNKNYYNETKPDEMRNGYQFMLHEPFEVLSDDAIPLFAITGEKLNYFIVPEKMSYDESIVDFTPEERNCWFDGERQLNFFRVYNRPNCEHECLASQMVQSCNCVSFYLIRNESMRICSASDENCFRKVEENFQNTKEICKCYQPCEYIKYSVTLLRNGMKE
jgi:hypothetical protein